MASKEEEECNICMNNDRKIFAPCSQCNFRICTLCFTQIVNDHKYECPQCRKDHDGKEKPGLKLIVNGNSKIFIDYGKIIGSGIKIVRTENVITIDSSDKGSYSSGISLAPGAKIIIGGINISNQFVTSESKKIEEFSLNGEKISAITVNSNGNVTLQNSKCIGNGLKLYVSSNGVIRTRWNYGIDYPISICDAKVDNNGKIDLRDTVFKQLEAKVYSNGSIKYFHVLNYIKASNRGNGSIVGSLGKNGQILENNQGNGRIKIHKF